MSRPAPSAALAAERLAGFPAALREAGLAVDPARSATFLAAVRVCRLAGVADLARIGRVTLTGSPEDFPVFDAVFEAWFGEAPYAGKVDNPEDDRAPRQSPPSGREQVLDIIEGEAAGHAAADEHLRNRKSFGRSSAADRQALARLKRRLRRLPAVESRKWVSAASGRRIDLACTARAARRTFGETLRIFRQMRPDQPRRMLLLIDVSGSMKAHAEANLRFAQLLTRARPKVETFCFGTRLTRVTKALKHRDAEQALARLSDIVFDFDGGTMIGASLGAFLSASRYAALVRGAVAIVFSDGLERGDPAAMAQAVARLSRLSHRLVWASPLAADPRYRPATRGMAGVLPYLDALVDDGGLGALARMVEGLQQVEAGARRQAARQYAEGRSAT